MFGENKHAEEDIWATQVGPIRNAAKRGEMFAENERKVRHLTPATVSSHTALPLVRILSGHPFIRQVSPVKSRKFAFVINSDVQ